MLKIIGTQNCSACEMARNILNSKGIPYEYLYFSDMPKSNQEELRKRARSFPIILNEKDEIKTLKEVL